ncbi:putative mannan endo-1,4-beta-mannosidase [Helianthus anomalus]
MALARAATTYGLSSKGVTSVDWIEEMSSFVKSIDRKHMLTIGLEGFYGPNSPKKDTVNPEFWAADLGADFIRNSAPSTVDFASVHIYPDHWFKKKSLEGKLMFVAKWMRSHIEDGDQVLKKPVMFIKFGLSDLNKEKGGRGRIFAWQFFVEGMEDYNDDFGIVPWKRASTYEIIIQHTCRLAKAHGTIASQKENLKHLCNQR